MSDKRRRLGPRLARIAEGVDSLAIERASAELGEAGPKRHLVVHVQEGETINAAITRTMDVNTWARGLSAAARARLTRIVVVRKHTRSVDPECQRAAWREARKLLVAGASMAEACDRSGLTELEIREGWDSPVSA